MLYYISLYACIFWSIFNFTSAIMGGLYVASDLGGSTDISSYNVTFFGLGNALTFPLARILADRWGALKVLKISIFPFLASLALCGLSNTFFVFVCMRFLSGALCGVFFPLSSRLLNREKVPASSAILALLTTITPVFGACFGGWLAYDFHWRWIFFLQLPLVLFSLLPLLRQKELPEFLKHTPFDTFGYALYCLATGAGISFLTLGQQLDWLRSTLLCFFLSIAIVSSIGFLVRELRCRHPFMDLYLFKTPLFSLSVLFVSVLFSAYFGMIILLSLWLHTDVNYTPIWISILLLNMIIAGMLLFIFVLRWMKKVPLLLPVSLAIISFAISCFYSATFNVEVDFIKLSIARIFAGFGLAFFLFPLLSICLNCVNEAKKEEALSIFQSCRLLSGALGTCIYTTIWYRRKVFFHDRLDESLTQYQENTQEFLLVHLKPYAKTPTIANQFLEEALTKQANALGLADSFYLMGWIMIFLLAILLLYLLCKTRPSL